MSGGGHARVEMATWIVRCYLRGGREEMYCKNVLLAVDREVKGLTNFWLNELLGM